MLYAEKYLEVSVSDELVSVTRDEVKRCDAVSLSLTSMKRYG